jgi:replication fork protection complex subunit Csm3/Swi3
VQFSDAARLLSFYQLWLDDLFPKAKFLDALTMVEKAGHGKNMAVLRKQWIDEGKPKTTQDNDDDDIPFGASREETPRSKDSEPTRLAPVFEQAAAQAKARTEKTPTKNDDPFASDEDIYNATPRRPAAAKFAAVSEDVPGDDLDALMAETEAQPAATSLFGDSLFGPRKQAGNAPDDDDLEALMAEAEAQDSEATGKHADLSVQSSIFGGRHGSSRVNCLVEEDDLDALMAEAENMERANKAPVQSRAPGEGGTVDAVAEDGIRAEDAQAMEEMEGLW